MIVRGEHHVCGSGDGGESLYCWGSNFGGQVGQGKDPAGTNYLEPVEVKGITGVTLLGLGKAYTCAAVENGEIYCWGDNEHGQLGTGKIGKAAYVPTKVEQSNQGKAVMLVTGTYHTCACYESGKLFCWGRNQEGQLGNGGDEDTPEPQLVDAGGKVKMVAVGAYHTCAVLTTDQVKCWGDNTL